MPAKIQISENNTKQISVFVLLSSESIFDEVKVNQLFRNNHQNPVTPFKTLRHHLPGNQDVKPPSGEILVFYNVVS